MPTLKQISKTKYWWGKLKPGAKIRVGSYGNFVDITVDQGDTVRRMFQIHTSYGGREGWYDERGGYHPPEIDETLTEVCFVWPWNGKYEDARCAPDQIDYIEFPAVPKSFRTSATKGSRWRFTKDWTFAGYDGQFEERTIPAGTEVVVANNKMSMAYWAGGLWDKPKPGIDFEEKSIQVEYFDAIQALGQMANSRNNNEYWLPVKEIASIVELVEDGQQRVYWSIEDNDGKKLVAKRYNNLGNVKAALRVRGGLIRNDYDNDSIYKERAPYWIESDNEWGTAKLPLDNGVWAVKYDHGTDAEIEREEMLEYMTMAKLSA